VLVTIIPTSDHTSRPSKVEKENTFGTKVPPLIPEINTEISLVVVIVVEVSCEESVAGIGIITFLDTEPNTLLKVGPVF